MQKAKILLVLILVCSMTGGLLAFKISRFTSEPVFTPTTIVYETVGNKIYYTTGSLCTTTPWYITTVPGSLSHVYYLVTSQPIGVKTLQAISGTETITRQFYWCTTTITNITTAM